MKIGKIKALVLNILKLYPETRDCDKKLFILYCKEYHSGSVVYSKSKDKRYLDLELFLFSIPTTETIRRSRQIIQNKMKLYPPTDERVAKIRNLEEERIRAYFTKEIENSIYP